MEYVVFSMGALQEMFYTIYVNLGTIFSFALYLFVTVLGVHVFLDIINYFAR